MQYDESSHTAMERHSVFAVMPISERTEDLWQLGIYETCTRLGWACTRADAVMEPGFIVSQIQQQLNAADVVIGEVTERNPNVFYEIGLAILTFPKSDGSSRTQCQPSESGPRPGRSVGPTSRESNRPGANAGRTPD